MSPELIVSIAGPAYVFYAFVQACIFMRWARESDPFIFFLAWFFAPVITGVAIIESIFWLIRFGITFKI